MMPRAARRRLKKSLKNDRRWTFPAAPLRIFNGELLPVAMEKSVKILSPAKVNLFLAVTGMRSDGMHNIFSAIVPLNFADAIEISDSRSGRDEIICPAEYLDPGNNTVAKALHIFRRQSGSGRHFRVSICKNIPPQSGFGGGSSNGAAVLSAANATCGNPLSPADLVRLGAEIGADCPFFIANEPSIVTGIGDVCEPMDAQLRSALGNYRMMIFKPNFGISTAQAYATLRTKFRHSYTGEDGAREKFSLLRRSMIAGEVLLPLFNTFSEIFFAQHGQLEKLCRSLAEVNASVTLTGSGSGFLCVVHNSVAASADEIVRGALGDGAFIRRVTPICGNKFEPLR
jgi:4-diphosphocytidyl-2-C-methyl-D-erythritol kinase